MKSVSPSIHLPIYPLRVKDYILCLLSAVLLIFSFPNFNLWLFAWFGFVPLLLALENKSKFKAFLLSYLTGVIFWLGIIYWLIHVTLPGMIMLVLYLALYSGIFGLLISSIQHPPFANRQVAFSIQLFFIPSVWVLLEYLRSHLFTGFGWALLGYCQYLNLPIIQIADITGAWGVSFLVIMVNVVIYEVIDHKSWVIGKRPDFLLVTLLLFLSLGYGYYKLYLSPITYHLSPIKISVIQGNIPQELKWDKSFKDFIIEEYFKLSRKALNDKPNLIIWPEAAFPGVLEEEPLCYEKVSTFAKEIRTPLLLGTVTKRRGLYYNSALLVTDEGRQLNRYDKLHLVPFGEYIPLRRILGFLETVVPIGDFARGGEYTIFKIPNPQPAGFREAQSQGAQTKVWEGGGRVGVPNNFSVLICFEDLFPQISREFTKRGADFLVNITNDAWFKKTSSPYQHLQASVFRAIENRLFLVRSANTGVSGFINPYGKIISLVKDKSGMNIFIKGYSTQEIFAHTNLSFYSRFGDMFIILLFIFVIYSIFRLIRWGH